MNHLHLLRRALVATAISLLLPMVAQAHRTDRHDEADTIYTMSNDPAGNRVLSFAQRSDGRLVAGATYPTRGLGTGTGLGTQGALATDGEFLLVVNAASDDVAVFRQTRNGLRQTDLTASGGVRPVSITIDRDRVYVLNAGSDSIAGFTLRHSGRLDALPGSEQPLTGTGTDPAQIQFSKDGRTLIVTEKATNQIVTFSLNRSGVPVDRHVVRSPGDTPFGFALGRGRQMFVSEAAGGASNASSLSSFRVARDGKLATIESSVPTHQTAACWVAVSPDGRFAYTTNTGSGTISAFRVWGAGHLELVPSSGVAGTVNPGGAPIDLAFSEQGEFLHVLSGGTASISTFRADAFGRLTRIGTMPVADGTNGLVALRRE